MELPVIGRAHRDGEDAAEFTGIGSGRDEIARAPRAAGLEQAKDGAAIVEHGLPLSGWAARNNPASQAGFGR
jgi:hypothetical protein